MVSEFDVGTFSRISAIVLILVLAGHGLGAQSQILGTRRLRYVLILVLAGHGLGVDGDPFYEHLNKCLNPCFSWTWSRSGLAAGIMVAMDVVLILVLAGHGLGAESE